VIVTGGPGTGKTTTLRGIIEILEQRGLKIALAAPTGRAAKRMEELTGREAKTVHRLLEVMWDERDRPYFARNERNPLSADAVIIDEISMVDSLLFEALLRALNPGCRLILVGDVCQLPSVGAGNIIGDLIDCGKIPTVTMTSIFRQASESAIITNAHKIVNGEYPDLRVKNSDFFFLNFENPSQAAAAVRDLCAKRLPEAYGYSALSDIQVLCPSKKLRTGTAELNNILQSVLNPACETKPQLNFEGYCLRLGDKVMQIKNNYQIPFTKEDGTVSSGVFNGDIGIVSKFDSKNCTLFVTYDDRIAEYGFEEASDLELAYAVTVHKSQGNEYPCVVIPLCSVPGPLCFRNLLYTAVTRAKQKLIIVGSEAVIKRMVENDRKTLRYTCLKHLLEEI
ncbi:MAG: ATP-dependent RecD-like DNA helicase, partial [Acutalibacteraceae bacterium]